MITTKTLTMVLRSGDRFTLAKDYEVDLLIVHLGTPPPVVELNGFKLRYEDREFHGTGSFEIRDHGAIVEQVDSGSAAFILSRLTCRPGGGGGGGGGGGSGTGSGAGGGGSGGGGWIR